MKILFIAVGFPPATMSENLCNGKLVLAFLRKGWHVDVITRESEQYYVKGWEKPWMELKPITHEIKYSVGNKIERFIDMIRSAVLMCGFPIEGIRWARRAYQKALELQEKNHYDMVITRSPSDISHIVGHKFSKKTGIKWIANWNDPATNIWPLPRKYSKIQWYIHDRYNHLILTNATINSFPAKTLMQHFMKFYPFIDEKKCRIFPHIALEEDYLLPKANNSKESKMFQLCYSGLICKDRDAQYLFKAIEELKMQRNAQIQIDILGTKDEYTENLALVYSEINIRFIGSYSYLEALGIMRNYDVLVLIEQVMDYGICFPSKLVDYAQLNKPILAISPLKGFVHEALNSFGGGIAADNTDYDSVKGALFQLYDSWLNNNLGVEYSSRKLLNSSLCENVIQAYDTTFQEIL